MTICETTDFAYPLLADVYVPIVDQGSYGQIVKQWVLDRTVACSFNLASGKYKQDVQTNTNITIDSSLVGRTRTDILSSTRGEPIAITNIVIANIRDVSGKIIYNESSGIRSGKSTIFELSTFSPIVGPFGSVEYYKAIIARSDNQAADV